MSNWDKPEPQGSNINYKSICCKEIPELFLDKLVAKTYFSKFGKIKRFILRPKRLCCTVEYETEDAAERALNEGGNYNGHAFSISYSEHEVAHVRNTEEWVDPDVQAELNAMLSLGLPIAKTAVLQKRQMPAAHALRPQTRAPTIAPKSILKSSTIVEQTSKEDMIARGELEAIMRRPAYTDEDKYRVLDARDKLMRLNTVQQTDIKKAASTQGTCPDMCPEKERYQREYQRGVSSFEMIDNNDEYAVSTISHRYALKKYSRSSADQETPLPHELRPESVLQITMQYLMHNIMDLCDDPSVSIGDWFHFVWDRTRSIRKDITQQDLCSLGTVQLVEQCARFHIHCAARLVAEDPAVFDKKINVENLTKCLQSLKFMYHDLRLKNITCPCEQEFRAYIVLLNMSNSSFLWEISRLPQEIQSSKEIKRSIAFYNALQQNNYVRFFNMVRSPETSYLSACILLNYFNTLRIKSMRTIMKAHNWRKSEQRLPLNYLTRVLGFENETSAANFFTYHGLRCEENSVVLEEMDVDGLQYSTERALKLVESKRTVSVGECVCGQPLPPSDIFENHAPHNSFDSNNVLKSVAWNAEDQLRGEAAKAKALENKQRQQSQITAQQTDFKQPIRVAETDNVFKIPQASPPNIFKQTKPQVQPQQQEQPIAGGFKLTNDKNTASNTFFSFTKTANEATNSIFKKAVGAMTAPGITASERKQESIFSNNKSIFGNVAPSTANTAVNSSSIFGAAAKETVNLFQQSKQSAEKLQPMKEDNIFKFFDASNIKSNQPTTTTPLIFNVTDNNIKTLANNSTASIFSQAIPTSTESPVSVFKMYHKKQDNESELQQQILERRAQELQEEQERKQKQIQEEQQKLKQLQQQKAAEAKRLRLEMLRKKINENAEKEAEQQLEQIVAAEVSNICQTELSKYKALERHAKQNLESILTEALHLEIHEIVSEEYALMCNDQLLLNRYFTRWLQHTRKKLHQRKIMESTPIWITTDTRDELTAKLQHPSEALNLEMIKRYRYGEACDFNKLLWESQSATVQSVNVFRIMSKFSNLEENFKNGLLHLRQYFKIVLTLPKEREELPGFESLCTKWLEQCMPPTVPLNELINRSNTPYIKGLEHNVALCVRKVSGIYACNEQNQRVRQECNNADGIICFISCINIDDTRKRLHRLLKLSEIYKAIPLALIVYNNDNDLDIDFVKLLKLPQLVEQGQLSTYKFFGCSSTKNDFPFSTYVARAFAFLAHASSTNRNQASQELEMQCLQNWLESNLGEEMWQRWQNSANENPAFNKICSSLQHVVDLYHAALDQLQQIIADDMENCVEFPVELLEFVPKVQNELCLGLEHFPRNWKDPARQEKIVNWLKELRLPDLNLPELPIEKVEDLEFWLVNYVAVCVPSSEEQAIRIAYDAIKALVDQLNRTDLKNLEVTDRLFCINYLPVVKVLVFGYVNNNVLKNDKLIRNLPNEFIYRRQKLLNYQTQPWWLNCKSVESVRVDYTLQTVEEVETAAEACNYELDIDEWEAIIEKADATINQANERENLMLQKKSPSALTKLTLDLDATFYDYDLAKNRGAFNYEAIVKDEEVLSDYTEEDGAVGGAVAMDTHFSRRNKRKYSPQTEADLIMSRALSIIEKLEANEDNRLKFARLTAD